MFGINKMFLSINIPLLSDALDGGCIVWMSLSKLLMRESWKSNSKTRRFSTGATGERVTGQRLEVDLLWTRLHFQVKQLWIHQRLVVSQRGWWRTQLGNEKQKVFSISTKKDLQIYWINENFISIYEYLKMINPMKAYWKILVVAFYGSLWCDL